jgi:hypothetical protein
MTDDRDRDPDPDEAAWNRPDAPASDWQQPPPSGYRPATGPPPDAGHWAGPPGTPPYQPPADYPAHPAGYPVPGTRPTNSLAVVAFVCSFVFGPAGVVVGIMARQQIRQRQEGGDGLALAAIIIGAVSTVFIFLFCLGVLAETPPST